MAQVLIPGFLPSTSGLHFVNYYPHEPQITIKLPLGPTLSLVHGQASITVALSEASLRALWLAVVAAIPGDEE